MSFSQRYCILYTHMEERETEGNVHTYHIYICIYICIYMYITCRPLARSPLYPYLSPSPFPLPPSPRTTRYRTTAMWPLFAATTKAVSSPPKPKGSLAVFSSILLPLSCAAEKDASIQMMGEMYIFVSVRMSAYEYRGGRT